MIKTVIFFYLFDIIFDNFFTLNKKRRYFSVSVFTYIDKKILNILMFEFRNLHVANQNPASSNNNKILHFIVNCDSLKMSPTKKKGPDAKSADVESKINEIITDGLALSNTDGKMEVDYSETTNEKVRIQSQDLTVYD